MAEFSIVGIGSSAGGLEALQKLFATMPDDSGLAFVIAAHLDPTQKSHLSELLGRCTKMPVVQIETAITVEPDHVYVIAPDQELTIRDGIVHTDTPRVPRGHRHPVDIFLRSLAEDQGERAIAIILSGTGSNGSLGLRFIKAEGGIVIVQEPQSALFAGMPRSAISTGIVDLVLPPEKMPETLLSLARHSYVRQPATVVEDSAPEEQLRDLLALVRVQTKRDFTSYKKTTLLRRIYRRIGLHQIDSLSHYLDRLRNDPDEIKALAADLTINVTGFFRDPEAWGVLAEKVLAPLVQERPADAIIRVWVSGCSTGEEAYSIAILLIEQAEAAGKSFDLKLFATDVAEGVLPLARAGQYPASIALDVGETRLQRFFERQDDTYQVKKELREQIIFAPQSLLQDPPFSHLDLISCRNLLIYIEPAAQKQVLGMFHFALRQDGHLFLGPAETIAGLEHLFQPVSKRWRIYRRVGATRHDLVEFSVARAGDLTLINTQEPALPEPRVPSRKMLDQALIERYALASVLIDPHYRVHYFRGPTENYLGPPNGEPTSNLLAIARPNLQVPLRAAISKALAEDQEVTTCAHVQRNNALHPVQLVVTPLKTGHDASSRLMVSFFERAITTDVAAPIEPDGVAGERQLQTELDTTRADLRLTIEQLEVSNEELKASNEEIRSINEELQASNEELETSKEELQSLNEELNTVNTQLQAKVGELERYTNDLNNLLNGTDVATLFLDRHACIRWFTPAMKALLALLPTDIGRPISHLAPKFKDGDLVEDARIVLAKLSPMDTEVVSDQDRWYLQRMVPYRTDDDRIDGVVVTFTDITARKRAEEALRTAHERISDILESITDAFYAVDADWRLTFVNRRAEELWGRPREQLVGQRLWDLFPNLDVEASEGYQLHLRAVRERRPLRGEFKSVKFGMWVSMSVYPQREGGLSVYFRDISERKRAEEERELLTRELSHRVKNVFAVIQALATQTDGRLRSVEAFREAFLGRLHALAAAHSLLLDAHWRGADLKALVEQVVAAYRVDYPDVIAVDGEPLTLTAQQSLGLGLVLHELGTNAAKHGALSHPDGRVRVSWQTEDTRLRLRWEEWGGPPVTPPTEDGFGSRLIEGVCVHQLDGSVERHHRPKGLICEIVFPVT